MQIREWYSGNDLENLPGLPKYKANIITKAKKEFWKSRPKAGQGGGNEFHISSLPEKTKHFLYEEHLKKVKSSNEKKVVEIETGSKKINALKPFEQRTLEARLDVLKNYKNFRLVFHGGIVETRNTFVELYNAKEISVLEETYAVIARLSSKTLQRWESKKVNELVPNYGKSKKSMIDNNEDIKNFILAVIWDKPDVRSTHLHKMIKHKFNLKISLMSVNRWLSNWKKDNEGLFLSISNPDAHKNKFLPAQGSLSVNITRFNQLIELDSTPADVMTTDGRYSIVGAIDVFSRRVRVILSKTSDSDAVCRVMRRYITELGVPEKIKTDNGKDYASKHFTNAMISLGIEQEFCRPYQGQEKPHIERFFGTMTRDLFEMLDGYIGHSVADRKAIESRKSFADRLGTKEKELFEVSMSKDDLQEAMDLWITNVYEKELHRSIKMSPYEKYTTCKATTKVIKDPRELDVLLTKSEVRIVSKKGIQLENIEYYGAELAMYIRKPVKCIYDAEDMGRIYVYDLDTQEFICVARNAENAGLNRTEVSAMAKQIRNKTDAQGREIMRKAKNKVKVTDVARELYMKNPTGNKAVAQKLEVEYVNKNLEEAGKSLQADSKEIVIAQDKTKLNNLMNMQVVKAETAKQRFARWMIINDKKLNEQEISEKENDWHKTYQDTPEFKSKVKEKELFERVSVQVA